MRPLTEGVLVESDVLVEFLTTRGQTLLHDALRVVPCFTTVVNAAELLGAAGNDMEVQNVRAALSGLRVLGLSARYALAMGEAAREARARGAALSVRDAIIVGTAIDARLPVLTRSKAEVFRTVPGVRVVTPEEIAGLAPQTGKK